MSEGVPKPPPQEPTGVPKRTIPEGELGSRTNPYRGVPGVEDVHTSISNSWVLSGRWTNAPAYFEFNGRTYNIDSDFNWGLEPTGDPKQDEFLQQQMQQWVDQTREQIERQTAHSPSAAPARQTLLQRLGRLLKRS